MLSMKEFCFCEKKFINKYKLMYFNSKEYLPPASETGSGNSSSLGWIPLPRKEDKSISPGTSSDISKT